MRLAHAWYRVKEAKVRNAKRQGIRRWAAAWVFAALVGAGPGIAWAGDELEGLLDLDALGGEAGELSPELLLFQDIPTVTLATKHEQPITLAPASISVITAADIKRQGARTITDVLRNVPGINVNRISNSDVNVAARFPADAANAEMLVLIDGRTVYLDFFGVVLWDALPVVMEDIERIEIIRGPASPLYGANAYAGIVNIITKDPDAHPANTLSTTFGTQDRYVATYIHAGSQDKWRYKVVASWDEINEFDPRRRNARENLKVYSTHVYEFAEDERIRISAGVDDSDGNIFTGLGRFEHEQQQAFFQSVLTYGDWEAQLFYNRFDGHVSNALLDPFPNGAIFVLVPAPGVVATPVNPQGRTQLVNNVFNVELQHTLELFDRHTITWGGGYRYNQIRGRNIFGKNEHLDIFNAFLQDEWALTDDLTLTGSVRVDHRQLTGVTVSPRLAAVYQWRANHVFRAAVSQAFRDPTQVENFISISGGQPTGGLPVPLQVIANGNRNLDPQEITSFEVGYDGRYLDGTLHVKTDVFYNALEDVIEFVSPAPGLFGFDNVGDADQVGGEIEVEYYWRPWLRPYINYSLLYFRAQNDDVLGGHQDRGDKIRSAPLHKVNAGVFADWNTGWSAMVQVHYVDNLREDALNPAPSLAPPVSPATLVVDVDGYVRWDARLAYRLEEPDLELSVTAFNLFNDRHREHPLGLPLERSVFVNGLWKF